MTKVKNKAQTKGRQGSKNSKAVSPPARNTAPINKTQQWAEDICKAANGKGTLLGLQQLGPATSPQNLLVSAALTNDPKCELAAEQIIHLVDGWRYAAAATSAYLSHSNATATHFSYYAELRAAMSLFAWSGIRAKWHGYYYLDNNGNKALTNSNPNTHTGVWELWNAWAKRPDVDALLANAIHLHPVATLRHVTRAVNFTVPQRTLTQWGADLIRVSKDHDARNTASYEALWMDSHLTRMQGQEAELVRDLWKLFLPDGRSLGFDAALCSHFVANASPRATGNAQSQAEQASFLETVAKHISDNSGAPKDEVLRRLQPNGYTFKPFELAAAADIKAENVLCRAFLLLRIAMLALKRSLDTPGVPPIAKKWLESWLEHAGLWSNSFQIDPIDIEVDYRDAVNDFTLTHPLPNSLWDGENLSRVAKLSRPDACIAWSLVA
jgi:hypothetical protein